MFRSELWERYFGLDSLKSMNRDMEEKEIGLRELSCRTAASAAVEAVRPLPKLRRQCGSSGGVLRELNCRRSFLAARRQSGRERDCTPGAAGLPLSSPGRSCSSAGPQNLSYALIGG
ncbi:unnamed protein product [Boreogadus saida]